MDPAEQMQLLARLRNINSIDDPARLEAADRIEQLQRNLDGRDDFIGGKGLWDEFIGQLPK